MVVFTQVVLKQEDGTAQPSFVATHLAALAAEGTTTQDDIDDIKGSAGTIYGGMMCSSIVAVSTDFTPLAGMETVSYRSLKIDTFVRRLG